MAYEIAGPEKILFSSDAPFGDMIQEIEKIKYVVKDQKHLDMILGGNAMRIMGKK